MDFFNFVIFFIAKFALVFDFLFFPNSEIFTLFFKAYLYTAFMLIYKWRQLISTDRVYRFLSKLSLLAFIVVVGYFAFISPNYVVIAQEGASGFKDFRAFSHLPAEFRLVYQPLTPNSYGAFKPFRAVHHLFQNYTRHYSLPRSLVYVPKTNFKALFLFSDVVPYPLPDAFQRSFSPVKFRLDRINDELAQAAAKNRINLINRLQPFGARLQSPLFYDSTRCIMDLYFGGAHEAIASTFINLRLDNQAAWYNAVSYGHICIQDIATFVRSGSRGYNRFYNLYFESFRQRYPCQTEAQVAQITHDALKKARTESISYFRGNFLRECLIRGIHENRVQFRFYLDERLNGHDHFQAFIISENLARDFKNETLD